MENSPSEPLAPRVRRLFDGIAPRYDLVNDVQSAGLHRLWKRQVVRLAAPKPGRLALDICTGTGDVALKLTEAGAQVIGLDFSQPMLQVAFRRKLPGKSPFLVAGDALSIPCKGDSFHSATICYGLRNLASIPKGLGEMARVLKKDGKLVILDFAKPEFAPWRTVYMLYLKMALPFFGWAFHRDPAAYAYIFESLQRYPSPKEISAALSQAGFRSIAVHNLLGGVMTIHEATKA